MDSLKQFACLLEILLNSFVYINGEFCLIYYFILPIEPGNNYGKSGEAMSDTLSFPGSRCKIKT